MAAPYLSIVVPAYNEEERIGETLSTLHDYLAKQPYTWEVIVVDDGSRDATGAIVRRWAADHDGVRIETLPHRGKGAAVRHGMLSATGDYRFMCDADLAMPVEQIAGFVKSTACEWDVAIASRQAPSARVSGRTMMRFLFGRVFNILVQAVAVRGFADTQCGFKCFRRGAADTLFGLQRTTGWGFDVEILYLAVQRNMRVTELPITCQLRRTSAWRTLTMALAMLWDIVAIRYRGATHAYGVFDERPEMKSGVSLRTGLLWICATYVIMLSYGYYYVGSIPRHRLETGGWILFGVALCCSALTVALLRRRLPDLAQGVRAGLPPSRWILLGGLLTLAVGLFVYWPVLFVGLVYDDYLHIPDAARGYVENGSDPRFRPVVFLLWNAVMSMGANAIGLHLLNVSFHAVNTVLTYLVAIRLGLSTRHAAGSATVFMVFPTSVEAVAWIVALPDVLTTTCCLLVLIALGGNGGLAGMLLASMAFLAALGTKETAVVIPAIAVAVYGGRIRGAGAWFIGVALAVAVTFAAWRIRTPTPEEFEFFQPLSKYLVQKMLSMTAGAFALPWKQAVMDSYPVAAFLWSAAITVLITRLLVRGVNDERSAEITWRFAAWIVLAIAPVYSWFFISPELSGGRYLYLAAPAWSMLFIAMLAFGPPNRGGRRVPVVTAAAYGFVLVSALLLSLRTSVDAWTAAARTRDAVLVSAASVLESSGCERIAFLRLPSDVDGAFVFSNGFLRALDYHDVPGRDRARVIADEADFACRFVWDRTRRQFTR